MAMTVIEVEAATGVTADAIRWYVRKGLLKPRRNARNGYYEFSSADLRQLRFIGRAKNLGFTLAEIAGVLAHSRRRESPCPAVRDVVKRRLVELDAQLEALRVMEARMRRALRLWQRMPDGVPHGEEVCRLVDSLSEEFDLRATHSSKISASRRRKS